jgi:hypothetical protein
MVSRKVKRARANRTNYILVLHVLLFKSTWKFKQSAVRENEVDRGKLENFCISYYGFRWMFSFKCCLPTQFSSVFVHNFAA